MGPPEVRTVARVTMAHWRMPVVDVSFRIEIRWQLHELSNSLKLLAAALNT